MEPSNDWMDVSEAQMEPSDGWMDLSGGWMDVSRGWMGVSGGQMEFSGGWMGVSSDPKPRLSGPPVRQDYKVSTGKKTEPVDANPITPITNTAKSYFWPYDIFGYLLPGMMIAGALFAANGFVDRLLRPLAEKGSVLSVLILIGSAYIVGHVVSAFSSLILEKLLVGKCLRYPTTRAFAAKDPRNLFEKLLTFPFASYFRPYSAEFQERFREVFRNVFGMSANEEHDAFWLAWSYISLRHGPAFARGTHFLELAGFSRNTAMCLLIIGAAPYFPESTLESPKWAWSVIFVVAAFAMFANYTKLMRRLNDEIYRGFVVVGASNANPPSPSPSSIPH